MHRSSSELRLGTRGSILALWQAQMVADALVARNPQVSSEIVKVGTSGDAYQKGSLADIGGKGLFAKEIDQALLNQEIDFAVHSLKDLETTLPDGIAIAALLPRDDARDAFIGFPFDDLPKGARVATCSVRRAAQVLMYRPDVRIVPMRGNVQTRLAKLRSGVAEATLLSFAGLQRLGLEHEAAQIFAPDWMIPSVGQGVMAVCVRNDDDRMRDLIAPLNDSATMLATTAERTMLGLLDGSCHTPIGGYAQIAAGQMQMSAILLSLDGQRHFRHQLSGQVTDLRDAAHLGRGMAEAMIAQAGDILAETRGG